MNTVIKEMLNLYHNTVSKWKITAQTVGAMLFIFSWTVPWNKFINPREGFRRNYPEYLPLLFKKYIATLSHHCLFYTINLSHHCLFPITNLSHIKIYYLCWGIFIILHSAVKLGCIDHTSDQNESGAHDRNSLECRRYKKSWVQQIWALNIRFIYR